MSARLTQLMERIAPGWRRFLVGCVSPVSNSAAQGGGLCTVGCVPTPETRRSGAGVTTTNQITAAGASWQGFHSAIASTAHECGLLFRRIHSISHPLASHNASYAHPSDVVAMGLAARSLPGGWRRSWFLQLQHAPHRSTLRIPVAATARGPATSRGASSTRSSALVKEQISVVMRQTITREVPHRDRNPGAMPVRL